MQSLTSQQKAETGRLRSLKFDWTREIDGMLLFRIKTDAESKGVNIVFLATRASVCTCLYKGDITPESLEGLILGCAN